MICGYEGLNEEEKADLLAEQERDAERAAQIEDDIAEHARAESAWLCASFLTASRDAKRAEELGLIDALKGGAL